MFTAIMFALKSWVSSFLTAIPSILKFISTHWRVISVLAIVVIGLLYVRALRIDNASLSASNAQLAIEIKAYQDYASILNENNRELEQQAQVDADIESEKHKAELAKLNIKSQSDRDNLKSQLEKSYAKKLNDMRVATANKLRDSTKASSGGMSDITNTPEYTESGTERDTTDSYIRTIERATAVTTSDFNTCSAWVDNVCNTFGCAEK